MISRPTDGKNHAPIDGERILSFIKKKRPPLIEGKWQTSLVIFDILEEFAYTRSCWRLLVNVFHVD